MALPLTDKRISMQLISRNAELIKHFLNLAAGCERAGGLACQITAADRLDATTEAGTQLFLVDLDSLTDRVLEQLPRLRQHDARSGIIVTYRQTSSERLLKAMRAGANDYLSATASADEFNSVLLHALDLTQQMGVKPRGRLITVFSNKGGVGTTTVAINAASAIAQRVPGPVAIVDLVLQRGDVSVFLEVPQNTTVVKLVTELDRLDASYLKSVLPHHASGLHVLPAPFAPDEAELVTPIQVSRLLERLCTVFDAVVVDAGSELHDYTVAALDASDRIALVTLPSLPAIRNTRRSLDIFGRLHYDASKIILVVNRYNAKERIPKDTMEEALGRPIDWMIPNDYLAVTRAVNQGTAVRMIEGKGLLAENFDQFAATHLLNRVNGNGHHARTGLRSRGMGMVNRLFGRRRNGTS